MPVDGAQMANSFWDKLTSFWKPTGSESTMSDYAGKWISTFGPMTLKQDGDRVHGVYQMGPQECSLDGTIQDGVLRFRYREPNAAGEGWFVLQRYGRFSGKWRPDGFPGWQTWQGERGFDGLWNSTFGPLRLIQGKEEVHGYYEGLGSSTIDGRLDGKRLVFRYKEPRAEGDGSFELADDGYTFQGQWRQDGAPAYSPWVGQRILPVPGLVWLVVLEAYWQRGLGEKEYAFGNMLREFFARVPHVEVRQRFFNNEAGLTKWCRELLYLAEPTALVLATHGTPEGLTAHGELIRAKPIADVLRQTDNIRVLHFSSCLLMESGRAGDFFRELRQELRFPISGYTTSVDWAASALIEFTYLDMILARGLDPQAAAQQVIKLIAFAGNGGPLDSPYPPAHFSIWQPPGLKSGA
jgi:hypothetical protein